MGAKKPSEPSAGTKAKGDDEAKRYGTAKDWRVKSGASKKSNKKAAGTLRSGTAQDWRKAGAEKATEKPARPKSKLRR